MFPTQPRSTSDALVNSDSPALERLTEIMARLRAPDGCPWDLEQDFKSIAPYTIEEAYEVADAIAREDMGDLRDELGDLLLQVIYHSQMAEEIGAFALSDVIKSVSDKMVRRHPHVFGDAGERSAEEQVADWERIKASERSGKAPATSALDGVALNLPALTRAVKLQNRAARVGFDWPDTGDVIAKIAEEAAELNEARETLTQKEVFEEFGDLMFVVANLARHLKIEPEDALRAANDKFQRRFRGVEALLDAQGKKPKESTLSEMDALWDAVKVTEKASDT